MNITMHTVIFRPAPGSSPDSAFSFFYLTDFLPCAHEQLFFLSPFMNGVLFIRTEAGSH